MASWALRCAAPLALLLVGSEGSGKFVVKTSKYLQSDCSGSPGEVGYYEMTAECMASEGASYFPECKGGKMQYKVYTDDSCTTPNDAMPIYKDEGCSDGEDEGGIMLYEKKDCMTSAPSAVYTSYTDSTCTEGAGDSSKFFYEPGCIPDGHVEDGVYHQHSDYYEAIDGELTITKYDSGDCTGTPSEEATHKCKGVCNIAGDESYTIDGACAVVASASTPSSAPAAVLVAALAVGAAWAQ